LSTGAGRRASRVKELDYQFFGQKSQTRKDQHEGVRQFEKGRAEDNAEPNKKAKGGDEKRK